MVVNEGQMLCVELVARNPVLDEFKVLFLGSVKYEVLRKVYETRVSSRDARMRAKTSRPSTLPRLRLEIVLLNECHWECTINVEWNSSECEDLM